MEVSGQHSTIRVWRKVVEITLAKQNSVEQQQTLSEALLHQHKTGQEYYVSHDLYEKSKEVQTVWSSLMTSFIFLLLTFSFTSTLTSTLILTVTFTSILIPTITLTFDFVSTHTSSFSSSFVTKNPFVLTFYQRSYQYRVRV